MSNSHHKKLTHGFQNSLPKGLSVVALALGLLFLARPVEAVSSGWANSDFSQIRLIAILDKGEVRAGLHIRLEQGWKTYWRSPGDSGVPTMVNWLGSKNVAVTGLRWPVPKRVVVSGYQSFVYENEVVLPLSLKVAEAGKPVLLMADIDYAVCKEICVPLQASLSLALKPDAAVRGDKVHRRLLDSFRYRIPWQLVGEFEMPGLGIFDVRMEKAGESDRLLLDLRSNKPLKAPLVIVEAPQPFSLSGPEVRYSTNRLQASFAFVVNGRRKGRGLHGRSVVVTAAASGQALETEILLD